MKNTYIFMIVQALLTLLLFFSEGYVRYTTIALFLLIDLILFIGLLVKRWSSEELMVFAALFCSGVFIAFYIFMKTLITTIFGVALMFLFLVIAMIDLISKSQAPKDIRKFERLQKPLEPSHYYDMGYDAQGSSMSDMSEQNRMPEPVMHIKRHAVPVSRDKTAARAVAYELEREAQQLKDAQRMIKDMDIYNAERELIRESKELENVQKQMDALKGATGKVKDAKSELLRESKELENAQKQMNALKNTSNKVNEAKKATAELKREAAEMMKVQKQINDIKNIQALQKETKSLKNAQKQINNLNNAQKIKELAKATASLNKAQKQINDLNNAQKIKELEKETKALKKADNQVKEIQFLNQQEKIVKQAKQIAKAQKQIDEMNKNVKKSISLPKSSKPSVKEIVRVKTVNAKDESFYFATENGNKFHEPGCLAIKNVPKNKLILFTSKKEAMKKGLQPCNVCIPK